MKIYFSESETVITGIIKDSDHTSASHLLQRAESDPYYTNHYLQSLTGVDEDSVYSNYICGNKVRPSGGSIAERKAKAKPLRLRVLTVHAVLMIPEHDPEYFDYSDMRLREYEYAFGNTGTIYYWDSATLDWEILCSPESYWVEDDDGEVRYVWGEFEEE